MHLYLNSHVASDYVLDNVILDYKSQHILKKINLFFIIMFR